jgi:hypothetical protein
MGNMWRAKQGKRIGAAMRRTIAKNPAPKCKSAHKALEERQKNGKTKKSSIR